MVQAQEVCAFTSSTCAWSSVRSLHLDSPFLFLALPSAPFLLPDLKAVVNLHNSANESMDSIDEFSLSTVNGRWRNWTTTLVCSIPCLYKHLVKDVCVLRHGYDFATLATRTQIAEFKEDLREHVFVKRIATLGPRPQLHDACEVRLLNRVMRWVVPPCGKARERTDIEADPRHSELFVKNSGLQTNSKGVNTLGERTRDSSRTIKLSPRDSTSYRSNVMRLAYLSADRIELQFASKEFARSMSEPTTADVEALKRCIRFQLKYQRCIQSFERQEIVLKQITCYSGSNFA